MQMLCSASHFFSASHYISSVYRRILKCEIVSTYCTLTWEQVDSLIPDAKLVFIICLVTYGGVVMTMYHVNLEPMFLEHEEKLVSSGKGGYMQMLCSASQVIQSERTHH